MTGPRKTLSFRGIAAALRLRGTRDDWCDKIAKGDKLVEALADVRVHVALIAEGRDPGCSTARIRDFIDDTLRSVR